VFPAIAIANALKARQPDIELLFVGAEDRMEMDKVPAAGYEIIGLWISGFQRSLSIRNLSFPFKLIHSMIKARNIVASFKPDVVVGVGGYASGPMLKAAAGKGVPTLIQEQNSFAGVTNRLLARKVDKVCVAYEGMDRFFPADKIMLTGNPVRKDILDLEGKREFGRSHFGLDEQLKTVLAVGGSLGARSINEGMKASLDLFSDNGLQVIWQTGDGYYQEAKQKAADARYQDNIKVFDFISHMDYAYAVADVIISRAGAIAVSELCTVGKPVILVPSPYVAEDHQTKNAMALLDKNAVLMVRDSDTVNDLGEAAITLVKDAERSAQLSEQILKLARVDAADVIAGEIVKMTQ
jgi:UDP-N-acetylglucosamine--N-acetylmuramyl-(pentapeptide) pyrophosphoryl-undecaprenol N-acetylglucosamine transferase